MNEPLTCFHGADKHLRTYSSIREPARTATVAHHPLRSGPRAAIHRANPQQSIGRTGGDPSGRWTSNTGADTVYGTNQPLAVTPIVHTPPTALQVQARNRRAQKGLAQRITACSALPATCPARCCGAQKRARPHIDSRQAPRLTEHSAQPCRSWVGASAVRFARVVGLQGLCEVKARTWSGIAHAT